MNDDAEIEALMRRCQQGFAGRPSVVYEQANQFAAACYGTLGRLKLQRDALAEELHIINGEPSKMLEGMEAIGWPCRAVELPQEYLKMGAQLTYTRNAYEELRGQRDAVTKQFVQVQTEHEALTKQVAELEERLNQESLMLEEERAHSQELRDTIEQLEVLAAPYADSGASEYSGFIDAVLHDAALIAKENGKTSGEQE